MDPEQRKIEVSLCKVTVLPMIADARGNLTFVEGAATFCDDLRRRFPGARVVHSLFEGFRPDEQFDSIILGHVLEHGADPVAVLSLVKGWLAPNGHVLAAVPNARFLHRQAAVLMGMLPAEDAMNQMDIHHGHRRVFNPESFRNVFLQAGLRIEVFGGYWMRPGSNRQIEETWSEDMLEALCNWASAIRTSLRRIT